MRRWARQQEAERREAERWAAQPAQPAQPAQEEDEWGLPEDWQEALAADAAGPQPPPQPAQPAPSAPPLDTAADPMATLRRLLDVIAQQAGSERERDNAQLLRAMVDQGGVLDVAVFPPQPAHLLQQEHEEVN